MNDRIIIIEDEKPAARLLKNMIEELRPDWIIEEVLTSVEESVDWFGKNRHPDLIFLDVHLSDGDSFMFLSEAEPECPVIFTTAYDEYAVRAFSVNSVDYLLKPVRKDRLETAVRKYETLRSYGLPGDCYDRHLKDILETVSLPGKKYRSRFLIARPDMYVTLPVDDIAFFYSENKISYAVTFERKEYMLDSSLDRIQEELDPDSFFRTNRQSIVNIRAITSVEPALYSKVIVHTRPEHRIPIVVSREKQTALKIWLDW